jgi:hypothetical protein
MGFRFRKTIKIAPGIKLNLSGSGVSTTIGGKGLSVNMGKQGVHLNAGIPGTGISTRIKLDGDAPAKQSEYTEAETYDSLVQSDSPEYEEFKKNIKKAGGKIGFFDIDSYNLVFNAISQDETIVCATQYSGKAIGAMVITDRSFYAMSYLSGRDPEKIVLSRNSIQDASAVGFFKINLKIKTDIDEYTIQGVQKIDDIIKTIKSR